MASLAPSLRMAASREHREWGVVERVAGGGLVLAGIVPAALAGTLLVAPIVLAVVSTGAIVLGFWKSSSAQEKANDPPRDDYFEPTGVDEVPLDLSGFGDDPLSNATSDLIQLGARAVAYEHAMVRADERAQGAARDGVSWAESIRRNEANQWGKAAAFSNQELAARAIALAGLLDELPELLLAQGDLQAVRAGAASVAARIPAVALDLLAQGGLDVNDNPFQIRVLRPGTRNVSDPFRDLAAALRTGAEASLDFAATYLNQHRELPPTVGA